MKYEIGKNYKIVDEAAISPNIPHGLVCVGDIFTVAEIDYDNDVLCEEEHCYLLSELRKGWVVLVEEEVFVSILESMELRFTSGNSVPVTSARITLDEWNTIKELL